jgi:hypothetical protein
LKYEVMTGWLDAINVESNNAILLTLAIMNSVEHRTC